IAFGSSRFERDIMSTVRPAEEAGRMLSLLNAVKHSSAEEWPSTGVVHILGRTEFRGEPPHHRVPEKRLAHRVIRRPPNMVKDTQSEAAAATGETPDVNVDAEGVPTEEAERVEGERVTSGASQAAGSSVTSEPSAAPAASTASSPSALVPQPAEMTPEERFRATAKLIFIAPDVPPIQPRPRRSDLSRLDDILDRQFDRHERHDRHDRHDHRESRNSHDDDDRSEQTGSSRRRRQRSASSAE